MSFMDFRNPELNQVDLVNLPVGSIIQADGVTFEKVATAPSQRATFVELSPSDEEAHDNAYSHLDYFYAIGDAPILLLSVA